MYVRLVSADREFPVNFVVLQNCPMPSQTTLHHTTFLNQELIQGILYLLIAQLALNTVVDFSRSRLSGTPYLYGRIPPHESVTGP